MKYRSAKRTISCHRCGWESVNFTADIPRISRGLTLWCQSCDQSLNFYRNSDNDFWRPSEVPG